MQRTIHARPGHILARLAGGRARLIGALVLIGLLGAGAERAAAQQCTYSLGFATLHDFIPQVVGACVGNESHGANGDALQQTANGLLVWRKADNWTAFTDGTTTWINGPMGVQSRPNSERFAWEAAPPSGPQPAMPVAVDVRVPESLRGEKSFDVPRQLNLPPGFEVSVFAAGLGAARFMDFSPAGDLYVSLPRLGRVWALPDDDNDGVADRVISFADGLTLPHGLE